MVTYRVSNCNEMFTISLKMVNVILNPTCSRRDHVQKYLHLISIDILSRTLVEDLMVGLVLWVSIGRESPNGILQ